MDYSAQLEWLLSNRDGSHWPGGSSLGGSDETTSYVINLLAIDGGHKTEIRGALEWLARQRLPNGRFGTTSDSIASMIAIVEVLKTTEPLNKDVSISINSETVHNLHVDDGNFDDFYSKMDAQDITGLLVSGKNTITIEESGTGDLFYELTMVQYLRVDVDIDYPVKVGAQSGKPFTFQISVDPIDSENVTVTNLEVALPQTDGLEIISIGVDAPSDPAASHIINVTAYGDDPCNITLHPLTVAYQLDAGERNSQVVRKYFGPIAINITEDISSNVTYESTIDKSLDQKVVKVDEPITVNLHLYVRSSLIGKSIKVVDHFPECFQVRDDAGGVVVNSSISWDITPSSNGLDIRYSLNSQKEFRGEMGKALVLIDGQVIGISQNPGVSITNEDLIILREYNAASYRPNEVITVTLTIRNPGGLKSYICMEDTIPPGFEIDKVSVESNMWDNIEVLSFDISDEFVTFFISKMKGDDVLEFTYNILTSMAGEYSVPSAKVYPMYEPERISFSGAHLLTIIGQDDLLVEVLPQSQIPQADLAVYERDITFSNKEPFHGETIEIHVKVSNHGTLNATGFEIYLIMDHRLHESREISVNAGDSTIVSFTWEASYGEHFLVVDLDPLNMIEESDLKNNIASKIFFVQRSESLWVDISVTMEVSNTTPTVGESVTVTVELVNLGNMDTPQFEMTLYDNDEPIHGEFMNINNGSTKSIEVSWVATEGTHDLTAIADLKNVSFDIHFENNVATVTITARPAPTDDGENLDDMTLSTLCLIVFIILLILSFIVISQRIKHNYRKETKEDEEVDGDVDVENLLELLEKEHQNEEIPPEVYKEMKDRLESNK